MFEPDFIIIYIPYLKPVYNYKAMNVKFSSQDKNSSFIQTPLAKQFMLDVVANLAAIFTQFQLIKAQKNS